LPTRQANASVFLFFPPLFFKIQFYAIPHGTLSFAPATHADPSAKAKEPFLPTLLSLYFIIKWYFSKKI